MTPAKDRTPKTHQALERWIHDWAEETSEPAGRLRRRVGILVLTAQLDQAASKADGPQFAIKGGSSLEIRYLERARVSKDVDLAIQGSLRDALAFVQQAVAVPWAEFRGRTLPPKDLTIPWGAATGARIEVKMSFQGRPFITLPLEVVTTESLAVDEIPSPSLENIGLTAAHHVPCLAIPHQIAEKLHASSDPLDGHRENDRVSDLMDLILIDDLSLPHRTLADVRSACVNLFSSRNHHAWPPVYAVLPSWPNLWNGIVDENNFYVAGIDEAVQRVNDLVTRIDNSP